MPINRWEQHSQNTRTHPPTGHTTPCANDPVPLNPAIKPLNRHEPNSLFSIVAENPKDWSDHALWWPQKNEWLTRTRSTLDQCGVHADALLHFTPMHKTLRVQLPDLRHLDCRVDFSIKTFNAVINLCKDLDIRHPEELSLSKPLDAVHLKKNFSEFPKRKLPQNEHGGGGPHQPAADTNSFIPAFSGSCNSLDNSLNGGGGPFSCAPMPHRQPHLLGTTPIGSPTGVSFGMHGIGLWSA